MEGAKITSKFQKICVYCGSSAGKRDCYKEAAKELAQEIISRDIDLVYGGGSIGLMGEISRTVHEGGCHVMGIIPSALSPKEITGETIGELKIVKNMHERKAEMAKHADCFIALPGGYGTMEEFLEILTWAKLGIHHKPIGLLNVNGYYNNLLSFIERAVEDEFISILEQNLFVHASNAKELMQKLEEFVPSKSETSKDE